MAWLMAAGVALLTASAHAAPADRLVPVGQAAGGGPDTLQVVQLVGDVMVDAISTRLDDGLRLEVTVADDSPADFSDGGALYAADLHLRLRDGTMVRTGAWRPPPGGGVDSTGFAPVLTGGFVRTGRMSADGSEEMELVWDFGREPGGDRPALSEVDRVTVLLVIANDYRIRVRVDGDIVADVGAAGNVQDESNQSVVRIDLVRGAMTGVERTGWGAVKGDLVVPRR